MCQVSNEKTIAADTVLQSVVCIYRYKRSYCSSTVSLLSSICRACVLRIRLDGTVPPGIRITTTQGTVLLPQVQYVLMLCLVCAVMCNRATRQEK